MIILSKLQVLKSTEGYFVGRTIKNMVTHQERPYDRLGGYYSSRDNATRDLKRWQEFTDIEEKIYAV